MTTTIETDLLGTVIKAKPPRPKKVEGEKKPPRRAMTKAEKERDKRHARYDFLVEPADPAETVFRHGAWQQLRDKVRSMLVLCHSNDFLLNRWDECGSCCSVEYSDSEKKYRLKANHCRNRHCRPCAKARGSTLAANLRTRLGEIPAGSTEYRFITLTLRHSQTPLRDQIKRLYDGFKKLRQLPLWKNSQIGGTAIFECKWDNQSQTWHPHLHIIGQGTFIRHEQLSRAWHAITGDSKIVDVRVLKSGKDAAHYVGKYVGKGTTDDVWQSVRAATEWITATKGLRTATTYGTWRGFKLMKADKTHEATDWKQIASLKEVYAAIGRGEEWALHLATHLEEALRYDPHKKRTPRQVDKPPE